MLSLKVGDRIYYVEDPEEEPDLMVYGHVEEVIPWTRGKKGFTWRVKYDNGNVGEFRSDNDKDYLFKCS